MLGVPPQVTKDSPVEETSTESVQQVMDGTQDQAKQADDNADKAEQDEGMVGAALQTPATENVIFIENSKEKLLLV